MTKKKITIDEWNKEFFNDWTKITKVTPHFEEWSSMDEDDESGRKWKVIERIDVEFDNGEKISIFPDCNKPDDEELSLCLKICQYKGEEVNWKVS